MTWVCACVCVCKSTYWKWKATFSPDCAAISGCESSSDLTRLIVQQSRSDKMPTFHMLNTYELCYWVLLHVNESRVLNKDPRRLSMFNWSVLIVEEVHTSFFFFGLLPPSSSSSELLFFDELESLERPNEPELDLLAPLPGVGVPPLVLLVLLLLFL